MACISECKWICIIGYILASLGAIVLYQNRQGKWLEVSDTLVNLYAIGGVITMVCAIRWAMGKDAAITVVPQSVY